MFYFLSNLLKTFSKSHNHDWSLQTDTGGTTATSSSAGLNKSFVLRFKNLHLHAFFKVTNFLFYCTVLTTCAGLDFPFCQWTGDFMIWLGDMYWNPASPPRDAVSIDILKKEKKLKIIHKKTFKRIQLHKDEPVTLHLYNHITLLIC